MNTDDLFSCNRCGIFFDRTIVKTIKKGTWDIIYYVCPVCNYHNFGE